MTLDRKSYYDGNIYYGEIDKLTQKREGLGIYAYHFGDVYFGLWKDNLIVEGMYIFRNGDSF